MIVGSDREIARTWAQMGVVPENHSSREHAARMLGRFLDAYDALLASVVALTDEAQPIPQDALPFGEVAR